MRPAVLLLFFFPLLFLEVASCGARSELDTLSRDAATAQPSPDAAGPTSCIPDAGPAPTCTTWQVAGPDRLISEATNTSTASEMLGSVIPVGCGVMLAWSTYTYIDPQTSELSWTTRTVAFDGTTTGPENVHSSLTVMSEASGSIEIAASTTGIGAVVVDEYNCRFLGLDFTGADVGGPVTQPGSGCSGLTSPGAGMFSYLVPDGPQGSTPTTLVTIDASGGPVSTRPLGDGLANALWGRLVFADGSFLLNAFREDPMTDVYTGVLQHFDATGTPLSPPAAQPPNSAPVMMAVTPPGALASWWTSTSSADFVPLDPSGQQAGSITSVPFVDAPYGEALERRCPGHAPGGRHRDERHLDHLRPGARLRWHPARRSRGVAQSDRRLRSRGRDADCRLGRRSRPRDLRQWRRPHASAHLRRPVKRYAPWAMSRAPFIHARRM